MSVPSLFSAVQSRSFIPCIPFADRVQKFHPSHRNTKVRTLAIVSICTLTISSRFGWFWECPNGENCQYRHALPPGFILKSQRKAAEEAAKGSVISLEEFLETEVRFFALI